MGTNPECGHLALIIADPLFSSVKFGSAFHLSDDQAKQVGSYGTFDCTESILQTGVQGVKYFDHVLIFSDFDADAK
jgi:hypothetical protein